MMFYRQFSCFAEFIRVNSESSFCKLNWCSRSEFYWTIWLTDNVSVCQILLLSFEEV